jgi:hypothetical protein
MKPAVTMMFLPRTTAVACFHAPGLHIATAATAPGVSVLRRLADAMSPSGPSGLPLIGRALLLVTAALALGAPAPVRAADNGVAPKAAVSLSAAPSTGGPCVQVDAGGYRAGHLDCAAQVLQAAARQSQARARRGMETPAAGAADVQLGVASASGAALRMGPNLGVSAQAWRPPRFTAPARP